MPLNFNATSGFETIQDRNPKDGAVLFETVTSPKKRQAAIIDAAVRNFTPILNESLDCIAATVDPEYGEIGTHLLDLARTHNIAIKINPDIFKDNYNIDEPPLAPCHTSFSWASDNFGLVNNVLYDPLLTTSMASLFSASTHELTHALALRHSPIQHASPWNPATDVILCPRDFVKMIRMCENDAFAKQVWFSALRSDNRDIALQSYRSPVHADWFHDMNALYGRTNAIRKAGLRSMESLNREENGSFLSHADHYKNWALDTYKQALENRRPREKAFRSIVVRMDETDMLTIGQSFGPNIFDDGTGKLDKIFATPVTFTEREEHLIAKLNAQIGIYDDHALPTFREQLASSGRTPEAFLSASLNQPPYLVLPQWEWIPAVPVQKSNTPVPGRSDTALHSFSLSAIQSV